MSYTRAFIDSLVTRRISPDLSSVSPVFLCMSLRVDKVRRLSISPGRLLQATAVHETLGLIARLGNPERTLM